MTRRQIAGVVAAGAIAGSGAAYVLSQSGGSPRSIGIPATLTPSGPNGAAGPVALPKAAAPCQFIPGKLVAAGKVTTSTVSGIIYTTTLNPVYRYRGGTLNPVRWERACVSYPAKGTVVKVTTGLRP